ncbi:MAG: cyclase family protein [Burkholderiales bacterium]|nr:cyclase family protein [Burkholderiales bacterium]
MGNNGICLTGEIIDITMSADENTPVYPGDTPLTVKWLEKAEEYLSEITFTPHVATHMDFPLHFGFKKSIDWVENLDIFIGECQIVDFSEWEEIGLDKCTLPTNLPPRVIFKFKDRKQGIPIRLAPGLIDCGVKLLGTNNASVDHEDSLTFDFHKATLSAGICILENLDLSKASPGRYFLSAAPLKWSKLDAVPVRAYLMKIKE